MNPSADPAVAETDLAALERFHALRRDLARAAEIAQKYDVFGSRTYETLLSLRVHYADKPFPASAIHQILNSPRSWTLVQKLLDEGLLIRVGKLYDRRRQFLMLTRKGADFVEEAAAEQMERFREKSDAVRSAGKDIAQVCGELTRRDARRSPAGAPRAQRPDFADIVSGVAAE